jgi:hypothetical protein
MSDTKMSVLDMIKQSEKKPVDSYKIGSVTYHDNGVALENPETVRRTGAAPAAKPRNIDMGTDPHMGNPPIDPVPRFPNGRLMNPMTGLNPNKE